MTSNLDVVKAWNDKSGDLEASVSFISDDFQNVDAEGNVLMNKESYIGMGHMIEASLPDFKFARTALREEGDFVIMTGRFQGTFTGTDLDLTAMGAGVIQASGKAIDWPEVSVKVTVEDGKIVREEPYGDGGGMEAFVGPLMA